MCPCREAHTSITIWIFYGKHLDMTHLQLPVELLGRLLLRVLLLMLPLHLLLLSPLLLLLFLLLLAELLPLLFRKLCGRRPECLLRAALPRPTSHSVA